MNVIAETKALLRELKALARKPDWTLLTRYDLLGKKPPSSPGERAWRYARRWLSAARLVSPHVTPYPWLSTLKHKPVAANSRTLLIWAVGADRDSLRRACEAIAARLSEHDRLAPVLVTDVADFAYFSRLGWLVEYVPRFQGDAQLYCQRKQAYLAWRYRDACIVPFGAGLASERDWNALLRMS